MPKTIDDLQNKLLDILKENHDRQTAGVNISDVLVSQGDFGEFNSTDPSRKTELAADLISRMRGFIEKIGNDARDQHLAIVIDPIKDLSQVPGESLTDFQARQDEMKLLNTRDDFQKYYSELLTKLKPKLEANDAVSEGIRKQVEELLAKKVSNHITRVIFNEFSFYPAKEKGPFTFEKKPALGADPQKLYFEDFLAMVDSLIKNYPENMHLLIATVPVKSDTSNEVNNVGIYVECGQEPKLHIFAKAHPSHVDCLYPNTRNAGYDQAHDILTGAFGHRNHTLMTELKRLPTPTSLTKLDEEVNTLEQTCDEIIKLLNDPNRLMGALKYSEIVKLIDDYKKDITTYLRAPNRFDNKLHAPSSLALHGLFDYFLKSVPLPLSIQNKIQDILNYNIDTINGSQISPLYLALRDLLWECSKYSLDPYVNNLYASLAVTPAAMGFPSWYSFIEPIAQQHVNYITKLQNNFNNAMGSIISKSPAILLEESNRINTRAADTVNTPTAGEIKWYLDSLAKKCDDMIIIYGSDPDKKNKMMGDFTYEQLEELVKKFKQDFVDDLTNHITTTYLNLGVPINSTTATEIQTKFTNIDSDLKRVPEFIISSAALTNIGNSISGISYGGLIDCETQGKAEFTVAADICLDHAKGVALNRAAYEMEILDTFTKPESVSHIVSSGSITSDNVKILAADKISKEKAVPHADVMKTLTNVEYPGRFANPLATNWYDLRESAVPLIKEQDMANDTTGLNYGLDTGKTTVKFFEPSELSPYIDGLNPRIKQYNALLNELRALQVLRQHPGTFKGEKDKLIAELTQKINVAIINSFKKNIATTNLSSTEQVNLSGELDKLLVNKSREEIKSGLDTLIAEPKYKEAIPFLNDIQKFFDLDNYYLVRDKALLKDFSSIGSVDQAIRQTLVFILNRHPGSNNTQDLIGKAVNTCREELQQHQFNYEEIQKAVEKLGAVFDSESKKFDKDEEFIKAIASPVTQNEVEQAINKIKANHPDGNTNVIDKAVINAISQYEDKLKGSLDSEALKELVRELSNAIHSEKAKITEDKKFLDNAFNFSMQKPYAAVMKVIQKLQKDNSSNGQVSAAANECMLALDAAIQDPYTYHEQGIKALEALKIVLEKIPVKPEELELVSKASATLAYEANDIASDRPMPQLEEFKLALKELEEKRKIGDLSLPDSTPSGFAKEVISLIEKNLVSLEKEVEDLQKNILTTDRTTRLKDALAVCLKALRETAPAPKVNDIVSALAQLKNEASRLRTGALNSGLEERVITIVDAGNKAIRNNTLENIMDTIASKHRAALSDTNEELVQMLKEVAATNILQKIDIKQTIEALPKFLKDPFTYYDNAKKGLEPIVAELKQGLEETLKDLQDLKQTHLLDDKTFEAVEAIGQNLSGIKDPKAYQAKILDALNLLQTDLVTKLKTQCSEIEKASPGDTKVKDALIKFMAEIDEALNDPLSFRAKAEEALQNLQAVTNGPALDQLAKQLADATPTLAKIGKQSSIIRYVEKGINLVNYDVNQAVAEKDNTFHEALIGIVNTQGKDNDDYKKTLQKFFVENIEKLQQEVNGLHQDIIFNQHMQVLEEIIANCYLKLMNIPPADNYENAANKAEAIVSAADFDEKALPIIMAFKKNLEYLLEQSNTPSTLEKRALEIASDALKFIKLCNTENLPDLTKATQEKLLPPPQSKVVAMHKDHSEMEMHDVEVNKGQHKQDSEDNPINPHQIY